MRGASCEIGRLNTRWYTKGREEEKGKTRSRPRRRNGAMRRKRAGRMQHEARTHAARGTDACSTRHGRMQPKWRMQTRTIEQEQ
eukprot:1740009-Pleurochrysis_carterae.AAC.1